MTDENKKEGRTVSEELEGVGNQIAERVQDLLHQGNIRRLIIKTSDDRVLLDTTLTVGAVTSTVFGLMFPIGAVLATIGATFARLKIEVVREITDGDVSTGGKKSKIEIKDEN